MKILLNMRLKLYLLVTIRLLNNYKLKNIFIDLKILLCNNVENLNNRELNKIKLTYKTLIIINKLSICFIQSFYVEFRGT